MLQKIKPEWENRPVIVAAPGPGLTADAVLQVKRLKNGWRVIACQDAYKLMPWADVLYGCNDTWWNHHQTCNGFRGPKWSTHDTRMAANDKTKQAAGYGINLVRGARAPGFSLDPALIHYGDNSGYQAINLAILMGSPYIVLVGFDMRHTGGQSHYFGDHPPGVFQRDEYESLLKFFEIAPAPPGVRIINATPDSALQCYENMSLDDAIKNYSLYRNRPIANAIAG